jgi:hypothetical protein
MGQIVRSHVLVSRDPDECEGEVILDLDIE